MPPTGRSPLRAAALLAAAAALTGCIRLAQPEQLPSPYAGTWQDRAGRELPDGNPPQASGSCWPPTAAAATAPASR
jgi:hypothetical protein